MATANANKNQWLEMYDGFDTKEVGLGTIDPTIYHSKSYQKRKKKGQNILIGGLNKIIYAGYENDKNPLVLVMGYEPQYNTIIGYNLNYLPIKTRKAILALVIQSNKARIKGKQPIIIDYKMLKKAVPDSMKVVRRYKVIGIRVEDVIPLAHWDEAIKDKGSWSNWHSKQDGGITFGKFLSNMLHLGGSKKKKK